MCIISLRGWTPLTCWLANIPKESAPVHSELWPHLLTTLKIFSRHLEYMIDKLCWLSDEEKSHSRSCFWIWSHWSDLPRHILYQSSLCPADTRSNRQSLQFSACSDLQWFTGCSFFTSIHKQENTTQISPYHWTLFHLTPAAMHFSFMIQVILILELKHVFLKTTQYYRHTCTINEHISYKVTLPPQSMENLSLIYPWVPSASHSTSL